MRDVAIAAGVAPMTVSYTFGRPDRVATETRAHVLETARRLGYAGPDPVARSLRRGSVGNLGVVLGEHLSYAFEDPQAARFLSGVSGVCVENNLGLVLIPSTGAPDDVVRVSESTVDGFVLWTTVDDDPVLKAVAATGRPAAIQGGPAAPGIETVAADEYSAARAIGLEMLDRSATPLLLSLPLDRGGWTGTLWGPDATPAYPVTRARLSGYRAAVEESGRLWKDTPVAVVARHSRADGRRAVEHALLDVRPDVVIAMTDQLAVGALDALGSHTTVSGWDDSEVAAQHGFTTIRQSLYDQGRSCARIAAGLSTGSETPSWRLVVRRDNTMTAGTDSASYEPAASATGPRSDT